jgi:hypothetical protein
MGTVQFVLLTLNEPIGGRCGRRNRGTRLVLVLVFFVVVRCDSIAQDGVQVGLDLVIVFVFVFRCLVARWAGAFFILVIVFLFVWLGVRLVIISGLTGVELVVESVLTHHLVVRSIALQLLVSGIFDI